MASGTCVRRAECSAACIAGHVYAAAQHKCLHHALYSHFSDASGFLSWETGLAMWLPLRLYPWCKHRRCLACMPMLTSHTTPVPPRPCGAIWYAACICASMPCLCLMNCIMQLKSCCRVDAVEHGRVGLHVYSAAACKSDMWTLT